ncbi:hypothetical protein ACJA25_02830 [Mycoplasmopsis hyopharyngis]|uniref:hypothetical protein n=1 Tax=Mycoplasmopsis hyopharyngis TaxID=29558 RepID=UPI003873353E
MKYKTKKLIENILLPFVIFFALTTFSFSLIMIFLTLEFYEGDLRVYGLNYLGNYLLNLYACGLLTTPYFIFWLSFILISNLKKTLKWRIGTFLMLSFLIKLFFDTFLQFFKIFGNIPSYAIAHLVNHTQLIFIAIIIYYKINERKQEKKIYEFLNNIDTFKETNDLILFNNNENATKSNSFTIFEFKNKQIFFNFNEQIDNISKQLKTLLTLENIKSKIYLNSKKIENNILQIDLSVIFKAKKLKLQFDFEIYITKNKIVISNEMKTKNNLLLENLSSPIDSLVEYSF